MLGPVFGRGLQPFAQAAFVVVGGYAQQMAGDEFGQVHKAVDKVLSELMDEDAVSGPLHK